MSIAHATLSENQLSAIVRFRRRRNAAFGENLFVDPAWDILLELYRAHVAGNRTRLSDLPGALGIPKSVTARWAATLEDRGLIVFHIDAAEPTQVWLDLSTRCSALMGRFLEDWKEALQLF